VKLFFNDTTIFKTNHVC